MRVYETKPGACKLLLWIIITVIFPPITALYLRGCGADLIINICLTLLGYIPGHIHAFYLMYKTWGHLPPRRGL